MDHIRVSIEKDIFFSSQMVFQMSLTISKTVYQIEKRILFLPAEFQLTFDAFFFLNRSDFFDVLPS